MEQNGTRKSSNVWAAQSDAQLVVVARRGEKAAFVEIVSRYQTMVCGIAFGILNDFTASEDVAQEAFLIAWRKLAEVREPEHLRAWLAQIARNAALTNIRRRGSEEPLADDFDIADDAPGPDDAAVSEEQSHLVRKALEGLPEQYRLPLVLFYCEGQSTRAVAESLGLSDDAVRQRLSRGREMLRAHMEGLVETVLKSKRPSAIFTMSVAAGIGALASPPALAAAAFEASYSPFQTFLSAMGASKPLTATAATILLISIPVGYQLRPGYATPQPQGAISAVANVTASNSLPRFEDSALLAEWRLLHEKHGGTAGAMPVIYAAIQAMDDPFRQSAFTTALVAEWRELDPHAALNFFSEKSRPQREREQFFREWFTADPRQALATVPETKEWQEILRNSLKEVALQVPDMVSEVVQRLPKKENFYDRSVRDAFGVLAGRDFHNARTIAEKLRGPNQDDALAGVAEVWARSDLDGAIAWAKKLNVGGDEIIRSALVGVAAVNPVVALEGISSVPPGGRETHGDSTTGARVLRAAARADFEGTVSWLKRNPAGLSRDDLLGLGEVVTEKLMANGAEFLTAHANDGSITVLVDAIESALMNRGAGARPAVWEWIKTQPPSDAIIELRKSVLATSAWHDPEFALALVTELPRTPEGDADVTELARTLLNGGHELQRFEKLYATAPERLREPLVEQAFKNLSADYMQDPKVWLSRVSLLPPEKQVEGIAAVARTWAMQNPEEAALWAQAQPNGDARKAAIAKIASTWAEQDEPAVRFWIDTLSSEARSAAELSMKTTGKR
ncbi:MAG TPA: sigma-70 family RNA polymerase sigma factor [Verrucomicrobiae bacterium]